MAKIGFVGLGNMGLPMAINLINAGHAVTGFDLNPLALEQIKSKGGLVGKNLKEIAHEKEFIITMLQTGEQVKQVCLGEDGLYTNAHNLMHIDCSSIDVASSRLLHARADEQQILSLDAPVSGGVAGAQAATLTFMVGGREYDFERAKPVLGNMGKKIIYAGHAGNGQAAKICNNMILGISMIAISEAFILANQLGLTAEKLFEVVTNASGQCWAMNNYVPVPGILPNVPANNDYQPGFTVAMMLKDLLLSQNSAQETEIKTPLGEQATLIYQQFENAGFGHVDFSAIIKNLEGL
jgi:3-hydroxyisobutyrate dehydrogenase